ncbi:CBS domain-containing protein [Mariprofundus erugo]|uniref:CBS domain-containing protein n=1 Tax=Mariprofundus erugo TaxID=2528639 RepID=A0A5R9GJC5_9PROT|nr:nucleotidyltransferase family protein [Mariprofundus erugo]TLS66736.1 CBS domain-containing protein [Mariprofundus erugo]
MKDLKNILVSPDLPVLEAIRVLDREALQILLVIDQQQRLLGTVTDGDIRRGILRGLDLSAPVSVCMNCSPLTLSENASRDQALVLMRGRSIHAVPVINNDGCVLGLETETSLFRQGINDTLVVLMAGGLGMRLRPLTESIPKPLLEVNGKPMLQHIIERFVEQGFRRFSLSVNYKAEMIVEHFGSGERFGVEISYLEEDKPLGTGGALSLLPQEGLSEQIIVMNGDLLTTLNFRQLLDFHTANGGVATMAVRDYSFRVPYGVVNIDGESFIDVVEKPAHSYFVNAGIYVFNSDQIQNIPEDQFFDLPDLFSLLKAQKKKVTVFPLREEWRDVGSHEDYKLANQNKEASE